MSSRLYVPRLAYTLYLAKNSVVSLLWFFLVLMLATAYGAYTDSDPTTVTNDRAGPLFAVSLISGFGFILSYFFYYVAPRL